MAVVKMVVVVDRGWQRRLQWLIKVVVVAGGGWCGQQHVMIRV